jgi:hypothetical protein
MPSFSRLPRSPRSGAEGVGVPSIGLTVHACQAVGGVVLVGGDRRRGQGAGLNGAIAHRVVGVGERLAGRVVGDGEAVEGVVGVGDDSNSGAG